MPCSQDIAAQAMDWREVPWRHQGRSRTGVDCIGLIIKVAHELGLSEFDTHSYSRVPDGVDFMSGFREHMDYVTPGEERDGDAIVLRDSRRPCHCGIFVTYRGSRHVVHAAARNRKVAVQPYDGTMKSLRVAVFRYRGLED